MAFWQMDSSLGCCNGKLWEPCVAVEVQLLREARVRKPCEGGRAEMVVEEDIQTLAGPEKLPEEVQLAGSMGRKLLSSARWLFVLPFAMEWMVGWNCEPGFRKPSIQLHGA